MGCKAARTVEDCDAEATFGPCEEETCWICLEGASAEPTVQPCTCPRLCHLTCLARWQLNSAGREEERLCRFCSCQLPSWYESLASKPRAAPLMTVSHAGRVHVLTVQPGTPGKRKFDREIRAIFGLSEEESIALTFGCKEPWSGEDITLNGWSSWDAAVECASISAGVRSGAGKGGKNLDSRSKQSWAVSLTEDQNMRSRWNVGSLFCNVLLYLQSVVSWGIHSREDTWGL